MLCVESDEKNGHSFSCEAKANILYNTTPIGAVSSEKVNPIFYIKIGNEVRGIFFSYCPWKTACGCSEAVRRKKYNIRFLKINFLISKL